MNYVVDTHVLLWHLLDPSQLSKKARQIFKDPNNQFLIPTISILEIQYLKEIGRIEIDMDDLMRHIAEMPNFRSAPFDDPSLVQSLRLTTTRDPFDRIILGQAMAQSSKILTKDRWMKKTAPYLVVY